MDRLSILPDELLLNIISLIPHRDWNDTFMACGVPCPPLGDYYSLALTCRSVNRAATTMLYQKYLHTWNYLPSTSFIEKLIHSSDLAALVKQVKEIGFWELTGLSEGLKHLQRSPQAVEAICAKIKSLKIPDATAWEYLFQNGQDADHNLESALIVCLTPSLEVLSLNWCPELKRHIPGRFMAPMWHMRSIQASLVPIIHAAQNIPYGHVHQFKNLRKLKLQMQGLHIDFVSPILRLESLRDLILCDYTPPKLPMDKPTRWECPPKCSNVHSIRLDRVAFHLETLERLISSCHALETFSFQMSVWDFSPPTWSQLVKLLEMFQPNLKALSFIDNLVRWERNRVVGSLQALHSLRYLAAPLEILIDPNDVNESYHLGNLFPASLQTLIISRGIFHVSSEAEQLFDKTMCNKQLRALSDTCRIGGLGLQSFGILYQMRSSSISHKAEKNEEDKTVQTDQEELDASDEMDFAFSHHATEFSSCGVHFDYVIGVNLRDECVAEDVLFSRTRLCGEEEVEEYKNHLKMSEDSVSCNDLRGFWHPTIFSKDEEEFVLRRAVF